MDDDLVARGLELYQTATRALHEQDMVICDDTGPISLAAVMGGATSEVSPDTVDILFEAAQGSLLDVDHGTYPYVTSSNSSTTGIWSGSGVPAKNLTRIIGVIKAYTSRVGRGPFPTELDDGPTGLGTS